MQTSDSRYLRALSYRIPDLESALVEIAHLSSVLTLPRGTIQIVSDVHGEFRKLDHILRNGSGSLRPLVEKTFEGRLDDSALKTLLSFIYYPRETWQRIRPSADLVRDTILAECELLRLLAGRHDLRHVRRVFPPHLEEVFSELLISPLLKRDPAYTSALLAPFLADDGGVELLRATSRVVRSFAAYEIIVAGDLGDRGPRIDRVIETLRHQRNISFAWGNHDAEWMGACLGQEALIATVVRVSLRYGRIAQLEEGYGIPVEPIEQLVRAAYANDPAERFKSKGEDLRDPLLLARMQKAIAILQFKLEGQTSQRNPHFGLEARTLLHRIDPAAGTVNIDGKTHPLLDRTFPTIDWKDPYRLTDAEASCMKHLRESFLGSSNLWRDMRFVANNGSMYLTRDENVVFHGCIPCDANGEWQSLEVEGVACRGRALFEAMDRVVRRAFRSREERDVDLLYYMWAGPRSPLFGKDRMATFETYFVADKATHKETKNSYFSLIHDAAFCRRVAKELGVDAPEPLIVNGHVPVKLEEGESPLKKSGLAVTIDGAFSEAYGDHGFTLVIASDRTYLAKHHHLESVESDIVPEIQVLRTNDKPIRVGDTARGKEIREEIEGLEQLVLAYRTRALP
jgi:fructose-1,6-bisphosphatase-3